MSVPLGVDEDHLHDRVDDMGVVVEDEGAVLERHYAPLGAHPTAERLGQLPDLLSGERVAAAATVLDHHQLVIGMHARRHLLHTWPTPNTTHIVDQHTGLHSCRT
jgi:hypothetical protein